MASLYVREQDTLYCYDLRSSPIRRLEHRGSATSASGRQLSPLDQERVD